MLFPEGPAFLAKGAAARTTRWGMLCMFFLALAAGGFAIFQPQVGNLVAGQRSFLAAIVMVAMFGMAGCHVFALALVSVPGSAFLALPARRTAHAPFLYAYMARHFLPFAAALAGAVLIPYLVNAPSPTWGALLWMQTILFAVVVVRFAWWVSSWLSFIAPITLLVVVQSFPHPLDVESWAPRGCLLFGRFPDGGYGGALAFLALLALALLASSPLPVFANASMRNLKIAVLVVVGSAAAVAVALALGTARVPAARQLTPVLGIATIVVALVLIVVGGAAVCLRVIELLRRLPWRAAPRRRDEEERRVFDLVWRGYWKPWEIAACASVLMAVAAYLCDERIETIRPHTIPLAGALASILMSLVLVEPPLEGTPDGFLATGFGATLPMPRPILRRFRRRLFAILLAPAAAWTLAFALAQRDELYLGPALACLFGGINLALLASHLSIIHPMMNRLEAVSRGTLLRWIIFALLLFPSGMILVGAFPRCFFAGPVETERAFNEGVVFGGFVGAALVLALALQIAALRHEARDGIDRRIQQPRNWQVVEQRRLARERLRQSPVATLFRAIGMRFPD